MYVGPPARGVRVPWWDLPAPVREWAEEALGAPVVEAVTQPGGFSPGVAARLLCVDGTRAFCKAVSATTNAESPDMHRREAGISKALPVSAPVPRLVASYDDGTWVALLFADVDGRQPTLPWREAELDRVVLALIELAATLTPSPVSDLATLPEPLGEDFASWRRLAGGQGPSRTDGLDAWSTRHLDRLAELEVQWERAAGGETLLHCDLRADNLLLAGDRVWVVDWPWAALGAAWVDPVAFAPSVAMQGGPPPEEMLGRFPSALAADPAAVDAVVCAVAGLFTEHSLRPPRAGLPTLRAFQAAQGRVARAWLARRTGWR